MVSYAIIFWLSITTGNPAIIAWATLASFMPQALIGIFAGVWVDRLDRKAVMMAADSFIALATLALAVMLMRGESSYGYFYALFACRSVGSAFHQPALQACTPLIVPERDLTRMAGVNQIIQSVCGIVAPVTGAALLAVMEIKYILLFDVGGAVVAISSLLAVRIPNPDRKSEEKHIWTEIKECFHEIGAHKGLGYVFAAFTLVSLAIMPVAILFPLITSSYFGGGAYRMSVVEMLWGLGAFAGGALLGFKRLKANFVALMNITIMAMGVCLILSGLLPPNAFWVFAAISAVGGLCGAVCNGLFTALLQIIVEPQVLGRVFSLFFSITMLPSVLGIVGTGFLADGIGIPATFVVGGLAITAVGAASFFIRSSMRLGRVGKRAC